MISSNSRCPACFFPFRSVGLSIFPLVDLRFFSRSCVVYAVLSVLVSVSSSCFGVKWWVLVDVSLLGNRLTTLITPVVVKAVSLNLFVCDVSCRPCQAQPDAYRSPWRVNRGQNVQIIRNSVLNWRTPYVVLPSALPGGLIAGKTGNLSCWLLQSATHVATRGLLTSSIVHCQFG